MKRSLVLGVNGQDGSYLAEALLRRGNEVIGIARDDRSRYVPVTNQFRYFKMDLRDDDALARFVSEISPDNVFHFAAVHGAAGFNYEPVWRDAVAVGILALHVLLEYARARSPHTRIFYASSAKIFPSPLSGVVDETRAVRSTCLYSIGKLASRELIQHYRNQHHILGTNLILFNHDSVRRSSEYFLPTLAGAVAAALANSSNQITFKSLDFWIDWSAADEMMDIVADLAEAPDEGELVLASGITQLGRDIVREAYARHGLDYQHHVRESLVRSDPGVEFKVSLQRLEKAINRTPIKTIASVLDEMILAKGAAEASMASGK